MDIEVVTAGADQFPSRLRTLVGGAPGSGKTRFALTAQNPLWLAARPGFPTLAAHGDVPFVDVTAENQLFQIKKALSHSPEDRETIFGRPIDTLVVDTVDELQRRLITGRLDKERRTEVKADDWNWIANRMNKIFDGLNELDLDIIYLVHLKEIGGFDDNYTVKPNLQGGFVEQIHGHVDMSLVIKSTYEKAAPLEPVEVEGAAEFILIEPEEEYKSFNYLVSKANSTYEWVNDKTETLEPFYDLDFVDDFQRIKTDVSEKRLEIDVSSSRTVDDFIIEMGIGDPKEKETKELPAMTPEEALPGTSSNEALAEMLRKNRAPK